MYGFSLLLTLLALYCKGCRNKVAWHKTSQALKGYESQMFPSFGGFLWRFHRGFHWRYSSVPPPASPFCTGWLSLLSIFLILIHSNQDSLQVLKGHPLFPPSPCHAVFITLSLLSNVLCSQGLSSLPSSNPHSWRRILHLLLSQSNHTSLLFLCTEHLAHFIQDKHTDTQNTHVHIHLDVLATLQGDTYLLPKVLPHPFPFLYRFSSPQKAPRYALPKDKSWFQQLDLIVQ